MFGTIVLVIATLFFLYTAWSSGIAPVEFAERLGLTVANAGGYPRMMFTSYSPDEAAR